MHPTNKRFATCFAAAFLCSSFIGRLAWAQDEGLTARTLYYTSGSDSEGKPAVKHGSAAKPKVERPAVPTTGTGEAVKVTGPSTVTHLGLRYNLMLIDTASNKEQLVDSGRKFEPNDCLALRVQSNYDGYLYVIDHGSGGKWEVMLPSPEMPEEGNFVGARTPLRFPAQFCFNVENTAGVDDLYVVFSRNPEDVYELNSAIKLQGKRPPAGGSAPAQTPAAGSDVGTQIARLERLQSRDLTIKKVAKPMDAEEPAHSVYVVNVSNTPSDRIVTQIQIQH